MLYVYSHTLLRVLSMVNDPKRSDMNYISVGGGDDSGGADACRVCRWSNRRGAASPRSI